SSTEIRYFRYLFIATAKSGRRGSSLWAGPSNGFGGVGFGGRAGKTGPAVMWVRAFGEVTDLKTRERRQSVGHTWGQSQRGVEEGPGRSPWPYLAPPKNRGDHGDVVVQGDQQLAHAVLRPVTVCSGHTAESWPERHGNPRLGVEGKPAPAGVPPSSAIRRRH